MKKLMGLVFDLDGTLLDSAPDLRNAMNQMLKLNHRREIGLDEIKSMIGDGLLTTTQRALELTGGFDPSEEMARFKEVVGFYRSLPPDPAQIYPGAHDFLDACQKMGIVMGICTNKQESATHYLLKELNLASYFEFVAGGDTFMVHKPNADHLLGVITAMDVPKENCAMVGDGKNDVAVARNAKVPCVVLTHGYDATAHANADVLADGYDALPTAIEKLGFAF